MGLNSDPAVGFLDLGIMTVLPPGNHSGQCMFSLIITVIAFAIFFMEECKFLYSESCYSVFPSAFPIFLLLDVLLDFIATD